VFAATSYVGYTYETTRLKILNSHSIYVKM